MRLEMAHHEGSDTVLQKGVDEIAIKLDSLGVNWVETSTERYDAGPSD